MKNIVFIGMTIMVIGILTVLTIPIASFTTRGIAGLISAVLFTIYLIIIGYCSIDKKG